MSQGASPIAGPVTLVTARLLLRPVVDGDVLALHALWTDPDVRRYLWDDEVIPHERAAEAIAASRAHFAQRGYGLWGVHDRASGELIGFCGCRPSGDDEPELLYGLRRQWWRRGLATEAAGAVLDHLIRGLARPSTVAVTNAPNHASTRLLDRLGMHLERRGDLDGRDTLFFRLSSATWQRPEAAAPGIALRPAAPADEPFLIAVMRRLADFPLPSWRTADEIAIADLSILRDALRHPGSDTLALVAEHPLGQPAGFVLVTSHSDYFTHLVHPHVETLAVTAEAEGHGVARALLDAAEAWATAARHDHITLTVFERNGRARAAYERRGYLPETVTYRKPLDVGHAVVAGAGEAAEPAGLTIRRATRADDDALWPLLHHVIAAGDTYAFARDLSRDAALDAWHARGGHTFVAETGGQLVGTYLLKPNQPGLGSHVANCGYMVTPNQRGRGIGAALCRHSLDTARALGFLAMQFNSVVSTNRSAIALWRRCGFAIVGTVPLAFRHPTQGLVDIHVMHRLL